MSVSSYVTGPIPNPGVYGEYEALALKAWNEAKSALRAQQAQIWQQYGFKGEFDPNTGATKNVGLDVQNPYGEYQQMLGRQGMDLDAAEEHAQERGLGGSGLGAQGVSRARAAHGGQHLDFGRRFSSASGDIQHQWQRAGFSYTQALLEAQRAAIQDAINNRAFNEGPATDPGTDPTTDNGPIVPPAVRPGGTPTTSIAAAAQAAKAAATQAKKPAWQVALAARSAGMNAKYGLGQSAPAAKYYTTRAQADAAKKAGQTVKFTQGRGYYIG